jgi:phosphate transport system permease protein
MNEQTTHASSGSEDHMPRTRRRIGSDLSARGEPYVWVMGAALVGGLAMILGLLAYVTYVGALTFWPSPVATVTTLDGKVIAGEAFRSETYRVPADVLQSRSPDIQARVAANLGMADRTLYRVGNYDLFGEDFVWVSDFDQKSSTFDRNMFFVERLEWGPFVGRVKQLDLAGTTVGTPTLKQVYTGVADGRKRRAAIEVIEKGEINDINHAIEELRLDVRRAELAHGVDSAEVRRVRADVEAQTAALNVKYKVLEEKVSALRTEDERETITLEAIDGQTKTLALSRIVRLYPANALSLDQKWGVYFDRWAEFITAPPREANTEGGIVPALVGTLTMMVLLSLAVAPFGIVTALYLREYAKQGPLVSFIRICVNNLAGVPSIVYGVFGLGFFCYILGGSIDQIFYPERLPTPTFGTGGILWASLTLALLTVPVVIVATEEALAAVPRSMREGSLACGASKWQTIWRIVLPRAAPGVMTGLILAMARGAGEVAPLMIVGVVKLAPELPIDFTAPFVHFDRSFMHLGFHIYDVGFQSRNSEAGRPMVFVTTLLLISLIVALNAFAIVVRERLKRSYQTGSF